jgi:hypothetical protein
MEVYYTMPEHTLRLLFEKKHPVPRGIVWDDDARSYKIFDTHMLTIGDYDSYLLKWIVFLNHKSTPIVAACQAGIELVNNLPPRVIHDPTIAEELQAITDQFTYIKTISGADDSEQHVTTPPRGCKLLGDVLLEERQKKDGSR